MRLFSLYYLFLPPPLLATELLRCIAAASSRRQPIDSFRRQFD
jgi:hypothetical protein